MTDLGRQIAFDTETTGLDWRGEDRVIEVGAVEIINLIPTGRTFRRLINPERSLSEATTRITGLKSKDVRDEPIFSDPLIVDALLDFIGDSDIIAHNAPFDRGFLNAELARCGREPIPEPRWIDTIPMARKKYPGAPASLDALCRRFNISLESRSYHGALLDSQLLAQVYLELNGGRAQSLGLDANVVDNKSDETEAISFPSAKARATPRPHLLTEAELAAHSAFMDANLDGRKFG